MCKGGWGYNSILLYNLIEWAEKLYLFNTMILNKINQPFLTATYILLLYSVLQTKFKT